MLARDWYYNQRRQIGLDSAVASIYDRHDDSDIRARAALTMLGVQRGWRGGEIGCGDGVPARAAAAVGGGGEAGELSPARAGLRGGADGGGVRRDRYFAGDAGAGGNPGARPQDRDPDPVGGIVEFYLSAEFL